MRLFIAFDLPKDIQLTLQKIQSLLPSIAMSKTREFHLTLQFLGECSEARVEKIKEALDGITFEPSRCALEDTLSSFGRPSRVIWASLQVPQSIVNCAKEIHRRLTPLGFRADHAFVPHITLARIKYITDSVAFASALKEIKVPARVFTLNEYFLFQSFLESDGPRYLKLARFSGVAT